MISSGRLSDRKRVEEAKYRKWFEEEKKKGLVDIKIFPNHETIRGADKESVYKELNEINDAIAKGDYVEEHKELF